MKMLTNLWWSAETLQHLKTKSFVLYTLCSTPLFLTFVVSVYLHQPENPPETVTGVIMHVVFSFLTSDKHLRGNTLEHFHRLIELAHSGTSRKRVVFNIEEIRKHELSEESLSDLLVSIPSHTRHQLNITEILQGNFLRYFLHQTMQEILTALKIVNCLLKALKFALKMMYKISILKSSKE